MNVFNIEFIFRIVIASVVLVVTLLLFRTIKKHLAKIIETTSTVTGYTKRVTSLKYAIACIRISLIFLYVIFLFLFFEIPGNTIVSFLGLVSVAITLLLREILLDYIFGFLILLEGKIRIDDEVVVEGFKGTVETIELRTTKIRDGINGDIMILSNRHFTKFVKKKNQSGFVIDAIIPGDHFDAVSSKIKQHYADDKQIRKIDVVISRYNVDKIEIDVIVDAKNYTYNQLKQEVLKIINEV